MLGAMKVYARYGQALLVSPFIMQGANTPGDHGGALAQLNARRWPAWLRPARTPRRPRWSTATPWPRCPCSRARPPTEPRRRSCSGWRITQLARRYGVPSRTAGMRTGSKACDADAGAQSMIAMLSALLGRVHFVLHAAGFLESGLSASFAKMVIDADQLSHLLGLIGGLDVDDGTLALDAIREVGPSGHFFGHGHTIEHYDSVFYPPDDGGVRHLGTSGRRRAGRMWRRGPPPSRPRSSTRSSRLRSTRGSRKGSTSSWPAAGASCRTRRSERGERASERGRGKSRRDEAPSGRCGRTGSGPARTRAWPLRRTARLPAFRRASARPGRPFPSTPRPTSGTASSAARTGARGRASPRSTRACGARSPLDTPERPDRSGGLCVRATTATASLPSRRCPPATSVTARARSRGRGVQSLASAGKPFR